jgi:hypothetical protein
MRQLHRRQLVAHFAEYIGTGLFIGGGTGLLAVLVCWIMGWPAGLPSGGILLAAILGGLGMGVYRRPRPLEAAIAVDEQLHLADLMSSSLLMLPKVKVQADSWSSSLLTLADARSRIISPTDVHFGHWSARRWGGLALVLALQGTLAFGLSRPFQKSSTSSVAAAVQTDDLLTVASSESVTSPLAPPAFSRPRPPASSDDPSAENTDRRTSVTTSADKIALSEPGKSTAKQASASDPDGSNSGAGSTLSHSVVQIPNSDRTSAASSSGQGPTANGGHSDTSSDAAKVGATAKAGSTSGENRLAAAPPWQSSRWEQNQASAMATLKNQVEYRPYADLIREYFAR